MNGQMEIHEPAMDRAPETADGATAHLATYKKRMV
jgi:hypothetical protein